MSETITLMLHFMLFTLGFLSAELYDRLEIQDVRKTGFHRKFVPVSLLIGCFFG